MGEALSKPRPTLERPPGRRTVDHTPPWYWGRGESSQMGPDTNQEEEEEELVVVVGVVVEFTSNRTVTCARRNS